MRYVLGISAAAVAITLIASSAFADVEQLNGIKQEREVVGPSGNLFYPLLVSMTDGAVHKCVRNTTELRGYTVRFCAGSGGYKALRDHATPTVATSN